MPTEGPECLNVVINTDYSLTYIHRPNSNFNLIRVEYHGGVYRPHFLTGQTSTDVITGWKRAFAYGYQA